MAWEWIRFVSNAQMDDDLAALEGYDPVWKENWQKPAKLASPSAEATQYIMKQPTGPYYDHPYIDEISTSLGQAVQSILLGASPKDGLGKATGDINKLLVKSLK